MHYLKSLNAEKVVWLSEDATGIVAKIEFDPQSNQMIGLVLPINSTTGLPMPFSFLARSANEIKYNIDKKAKSSLVYIVMAQPLIPKAPPFLLQMFGTDNKFKTQDVLFRWRHTVQELERYLKLNHEQNNWNIPMIEYFQMRHKGGWILFRW